MRNTLINLVASAVVELLLSEINEYLNKRLSR
ncbi:hypothetical protein EDB47_10924 [Vibrio crassostreae]|nr:hypothetical protein EDB43_10824 [Vibrio crassostreae]TCU03770.1 hypothetical protein EDB47_10924 [Vibrio crassostreae]